MQYYECHITFENTDPDRTKTEILNLGWKYSRIDGDPVMGDGVKQYATKHYPKRLGDSVVLNNVERVSMLLSHLGVTRSKVELVLHDTKSFHVA